MSDYQHTPSITLSVRRCHECGRFYAVESFPQCRCPYCAERKVEEAHKAQAKAERSASALRGALSRRKP